jgi:hypothetical protein
VGSGPLYLYGIVGAGAELPRSLRGVGDGPVRLLDGAPLGAVVTDLPGLPYDARREDLMAHSDALQTIVTTTTVLPMAFGTVFESPDELSRTFLGPNRDALARMLDAMDGLVEMQVRAEYDAEAIALDIASSDRTIQKLQARARSRGDVESRIELGRRFASVLDARRYADARSIVDRLAASARDASVGDATGEYGLMRASFLVARTDLERFDRAADAAATAVEGRASVRCVGPLPPYSFVDASALAVG